MKVKAVIAAALVLCALGGAVATRTFAGTYNTIENSSPQEIVGAMSAKAVRGIANTATGWVEFPKQIYLTYNQEGPTQGILVGPMKGIGLAIVRTISGVGELATFFVAYPGFFDPYFDPPYVWQKE